jgi:hypothetical protein
MPFNILADFFLLIIRFIVDVITPILSMMF